MNFGGSQPRHLALVSQVTASAPSGVGQPLKDQQQGGTVGTLARHITAYITEMRAIGRFTGTGPETTRSHLNALNRWHDDRALDRLTRASIIKWLDSINHLSPNTRRSYLIAADGFCRWLTERGKLKKNPCDGIPRPKIPRRQPRALHHDAVSACLAACKDDRERAIIWLGVGLGLRRAEIASVRWSDYDTLNETLRVTGKGGVVRVVPVTDDVRRVLERIRGPLHHPVIGRYSGDDGRPLTVRQVSYLVRRICEDAGIKVAAWDGVGVHSLRHTAATDVLETSGDLQAVQTMLGHANLSTTSVYVGLAAQPKLRKAMEGRSYEQPRLGVA